MAHSKTIAIFRFFCLVSTWRFIKPIEIEIELISCIFSVIKLHDMEKGKYS